MATAEQSNSPITLPPYPDIIMTAIEELDDKNGSSKLAITKQIEVKYGPLPAAHGTLITFHLNKLKQSGQLVMVNDNRFMKPKVVVPKPSGRGRPPKAKDPHQPPRPRGRPRKELRDPLAPSPPKTMKKSTTAGGGSGRKRGRPRKYPVAATLSDGGAPGMPAAVGA